MESDHYEEFIQQLNQCKINYEFKDLILNNKSLADSLFDEFIKSEKVPSLKLFTRQFVSDEEWTKSRTDQWLSEDPIERREAADLEQMMDTLIHEFYRHKNRGKIDKSLYDFDIEATTSVSIIIEIGKKLELINRLLKSNNSSREKDAEVFADGIIVLLKKFENPLLSHEIAKVILENENINTILTWHSTAERDAFLASKEHFHFHLRNRLPSLPKINSSFGKSGSQVKNNGSPKLADIWLGTEDDFLRIIRTYANDYIENVDGKPTWMTKHRNVSFLAGFTYECQQKGWINKSASSSDFRRVYEKSLRITFDETPFKPNNLNAIDLPYLEPFKGIPHKVK